MDAAEKKKYTFVQAINTIRNEKIAVRKQSNMKRKVEKDKETAKKMERLDAVKKANKKRQHRSDGKIQAARDKKRLRGS